MSFVVISVAAIALAAVVVIAVVVDVGRSIAAHGNLDNNSGRAIALRLLQGGAYDQPAVRESLVRSTATYGARERRFMEEAV